MVLLVVRTLLAAVFAVAAGGKAIDLAGSREAAAGFGVPERAAAAVGTLLPIGEAIAAVALLITPTARGGGALALVLLLAFIAAISRSMRAGEAPECHCFGQLHSEPAGPSTLIRNGVLAAAAVAVLAGGAGRSLSGLAGHQLALLIISLLAGGLLAATVSLWMENRRLRTLPAAQADAARRQAGLAVGATAPDLALHSLDGSEITLSDRLPSGQPALLVHISPGCVPCRALVPELSRWTRQLAGSLEIVTLSSGDEETNRTLLGDETDHELLLTDPGAFGTAYRVMATPSAVAVSARGQVSSRPASGAIAIEALIRSVLAREGEATPAGVA
jgi:hypothetical protein